MQKHRTGIEEYYIVKNNKKLRYGYTTGSCAAAAAKAAAKMLLTGVRMEEVALQTPKGILLHLCIEDIRQTKEEVCCAVRKDGGDDPDVTHGILIYASVKKQESGITIEGGKGVGRVTKPGLNQPVGEAAINSTPRSMIRRELEEVCKTYQYDGGLYVEIHIPEGERLAAKTFNPRLGITGGISVLGTSGIVVPMSEDALIASIEAEMKMLCAQGAEYLLITPGNYGEAFAGEMPDLSHTSEMKCSNYVGETLDLACNLQIKGILFVAHIGKFIKVAGGIMNTHSRNADARAELMAAAAMRAGISCEIVQQILDTLTTEEAVEILHRCGQLEPVMKQVCEKIDFYLKHRTGGRIQTGAVIFSSVYGKLGETEEVPALIRALQENKEKMKE